MLEVILKHRLSGSFSSGIEHAHSTAIRATVVNTAQNDQNEKRRAAQDAQEIVMRKWNSERGMSLVEATIILMVLAILTSVIAPTAGDFVSEARNIKGKEDVESLAMSIMRLHRDYGKKR